MQAYILALWSDSLTYTMAKALVFSGHDVKVWIADVSKDTQSEWSLSQRIAANPGAQVIADPNAEPPSRIDRLIVQGNPLLLDHGSALDKLAARADRLTAVSCGDRNRSYRQAMRLQWREHRWYRRWFSKIDRIAYKDGFYRLDLFGLLRPRHVVGFDAHSKFLQDETLFQAIHARDWDRGTARPIRANFLGSRDPESRSRILDSVERFFTSAAPAEAGQRMVWHAYSDAQPAALSGEEFLQVLTDSDFTLSPPGYSLVTHRPVEALLRGSIPVLNADELDLYDLGLADGLNCIAVPAGGWPAAMQRIVSMGGAEVAAMRGNIQAMLEEKVDYPALARDMSWRLGIEDDDAA